MPQAVQFARSLEEKYGWTFNEMPLTTDDLARKLKHQLTKTKEGAE